MKCVRRLYVDKLNTRPVPRQIGVDLLADFRPVQLVSGLQIMPEKKVTNTDLCLVVVVPTLVRRVAGRGRAEGETAARTSPLGSWMF